MPNLPIFAWHDNLNVGYNCYFWNASDSVPIQHNICKFTNFALNIIYTIYNILIQNSCRDLKTDNFGPIPRTLKNKSKVS